MTKTFCDVCQKPCAPTIPDGVRLFIDERLMAVMRGREMELCDTCLARALREVADKLEPKQDLVHRALHCAHCGVDHSPSISCDDVSRPMHPDPNVAWSVPYNG